MWRYRSKASQRLEDALTQLQEAEAEQRVAAVVFQSLQAVMVTNARAVILRVNEAFSHLTGYAPEEVIGRTPKLLRSGHHDEAFYGAMRASIARSGRWQGEIWDRHKSGAVFPKLMTITAVPDARGEVTHMVATYLDLSERKRAEEQIHQLAFYDALTGLPNRALLHERLNQAMNGSVRSGQQGALLLLDLDNFKRINDSLGHRLGDDLLQQAGQRLLACVQDGDTVARTGGDEYVVLLPELCTSHRQAAGKAEHMGERILQALGQAYVLEGEALSCTASMGLVLFAGNQTPVEELLKQAELAMYQAKRDGRGRLHFFDTALEATTQQRMQLERELDQAIARDQLCLHYHPQVARDGSIYGAEALIRWQHPQRGLVSPSAFIPLAEETGQILALGQWVLRTACRQLAQWQRQPGHAARILAINVSALQFLQEDFVSQVEQILGETGIDPARLKLELTESLLVDKIDQVIAKMHALKALGLQLSLDDFGTGYSSLAYLKRMPLDQLKIDQSFVRDLLQDANAAAIAQSITSLARSLGLTVVAEGVESADQRDTLAAMGCGIYQGYYYSPPLPLQEYETWLPASDTQANTSA